MASTHQVLFLPPLALQHAEVLPALAVSYTLRFNGLHRVWIRIGSFVPLSSPRRTSISDFGLATATGKKEKPLPGLHVLIEQISLFTMNKVDFFP